MSVHIRPISAEELPMIQRNLGVVFGTDPTPGTVERFKHVFELDRLRSAFDGDEMVATFGAYSLELTVPGNRLPTAGTTVVSVLPTHRRQGIMRSLMTEHLAEVHEKGEPLAALWASESSIYGRFGYEPASEAAMMNLEKPFALMEQPTDIDGTMRLIDQAEALAAFPIVYDTVVLQRPGMFSRSEVWWQHRVLGDPEERRQGASAHRRVLHLRDGRPAMRSTARRSITAPNRQRCNSSS